MDSSSLSSVMKGAERCVVGYVVGSDELRPDPVRSQ